MNNQSNIPSDSLSDILTNQIEVLSKKFPNFIRSVSIQELGDQIIQYLTLSFSDTYIEFAYRSATSNFWKVFSNSGAIHQQTFKQSRIESFGDSLPDNNKTVKIKIIHTLDDNSAIGILLLKNNPDQGFSDVDSVSVRLIVYIIEMAYRNIVHHKKEKDLVFSLNHRILQLNSLIETGIEVEKLDQTSSPHHLALIRAASLTNASYAKLLVASGQKIKEEYYFPEHLQNNRPVDNTNQISTKFTYREDTYIFDLFNKESRIGNMPFDDTDQLLLDALAKQVYASLENRYLHKETLEKQRIEQEMSVAATIQQKIIPIALPVIKGYDLAGINIPSKSVGGDYFDCLPISKRKYILVVADVTGKGVPAALLVSSFHSYLSAYSEGSFTLSKLATRLNKVLYRESTDDKFITAFIVILRPELGEIEYINAGHNPAYVYSRGMPIRELKGSGLPLGMFPDSEYSSERITLRRGERLLLYTDGVTEAQNEGGKFFEQKYPLDKYFSKHQHLATKEFISNLVKDIKAFTGSAPQNDDITAMSLWRL